MEHIYNEKNFHLKNTAVCLGKFDGIHKGHRLLIDTIKSYEELTSVVFTFALHPVTLFSKKETKLIDTLEEKEEKLSKLGVDILISYPFTKETAAMEAEDFIKDVIVEKLDAKVIVVGKDYRFGYQRKGNVSLLKKYAKVYGYKVVSLEKVSADHHVVSSSRIRTEIKNGNMEQVQELLSVPYSLKGEVLHGKQLGRTIGMPTINQKVTDSKILPPNGVYVSRVYLEDGIHGGITNVGVKPTVSGEKVVGIETYIFDFSGDLYGKVIRTELLHFVRGERKFDSIAALTTQMHKDKSFGEKYLKELMRIENLPI